mgnify:CR=1 FL=1
MKISKGAFLLNEPGSRGVRRRNSDLPESPDGLPFRLLFFLFYGTVESGFSDDTAMI